MITPGNSRFNSYARGSPFKKLKPPVPGLPQSPGLPGATGLDIAGGLPKPPAPAAPAGPITTQEDLVKYVGTLGTQPYKPPLQGLAPNLQQPQGPQVKPPGTLPAVPPVQPPAQPTTIAQPEGRTDERGLNQEAIQVQKHFDSQRSGGVIARRAGTSDLPVRLPLDGKYRFYYNQNGGKLWAIGPKGENYVPEVDKIDFDPRTGRVTVSVGGQTFLADTDVRKGEYLTAEGDPVDLEKYGSGKEIPVDQFGRIAKQPPDSPLSGNILQQVANAQRGYGPGREGGMPIPEAGLPSVPKAQGFAQGGTSGKDGEISQAEKQVSDYDDQIADLEATLATTEAEKRGPLNARMARLKRQREIADGYVQSAKQRQTDAKKKADAEQERANAGAVAEIENALGVSNAEAKRIQGLIADGQTTLEKEKQRIDKVEAGKKAETVAGERAQGVRQVNGETRANITNRAMAQLKAVEKTLVDPTDLQSNAEEQAGAEKVLAAIKSGTSRKQLPVDIPPDAVAVVAQLDLHLNPVTGRITYRDQETGRAADTFDNPIVYDADKNQFYVQVGKEWLPAKEGEMPEGALEKQGLRPVQQPMDFSGMVEQAYQQAKQEGNIAAVQALAPMRKPRGAPKGMLVTSSGSYK